MLSIEEAWKDLEAQAVVLAWAIPRVRKPDRTLDAARALALAVLEEVRECYEAGMETEQDWGGLRARIEALGKEA